jgi:hypothetical protein
MTAMGMHSRDSNKTRPMVFVQSNLKRFIAWDILFVATKSNEFRWMTAIIILLAIGYTFTNNPKLSLTF